MSANTRALRLALMVPLAVYTDHHHHVVCGCICGCIFGFWSDAWFFVFGLLVS